MKRDRCLRRRVEPWAQGDNSDSQTMSGKSLWFSFESCNVIHIEYTSNIHLQWQQQQWHQEGSFTECSSLFRQYCKCISIWFFYQSYEVGIHIPLSKTCATYGLERPRNLPMNTEQGWSRLLSEWVPLWCISSSHSGGLGRHSKSPLKNTNSWAKKIFFRNLK